MYRWLEGETLTPEALTDAVRAARDLAGCLGALRAVNATGGPGPEQNNALRGAPLRDERNSLAAEARVRPMIEALKRTGPVDTDAVTEVREAALAALAWDRPPV